MSYSNSWRLIPSITLPLLLLASSARAGGVSVLTQHGDNQRSGAYLKETVLNTGSVNKAQFGKLFARPVDGQLYAQPLVVADVRVPGKGRHTVVYLATEHNSVYAYDADDPAAQTPYWQVNLGPSVPASDFYAPPATDMNEEVGITGTPVVDPKRQALYVVAKTKENGQYVQRLHALDLTTGAERFGGPRVIAARVPGTGDASAQGQVAFDARQHLQRPGLLLQDGVVYVAFGSHGDHDPYHGWVLGYDAATLQPVCALNTTPNGGEGAIWQAGQGLAADKDGSLYCVTGNGASTAPSGGQDYGEAVLKLKAAKDKGTLTVADWFIPHDAAQLNADDNDLGSGGPMLLPGTNLLLTGSKSGTLYMLNTQSLGHSQAKDDSQVVQSFVAAGGHIHGSPVVWDAPDKSRFIYLWSEQDTLKCFKMLNGTLQTTPVAHGALTLPPGMPGGFLAVSADGSKAGTGIVWAAHPDNANANWNTVPGLLQAFDAADITHELWNSKQDAARDDFGNFAKFCPPVVANGKVYLATFSKQLVVYGLLPGAKK